MKHFLSCDWGTSSLRLRLAAGDGKILAEVRSQNGIAQTFAQWQQSGLPEDERAGFYLAILARQIKELAIKTSRQLNGLTVILSGMASSSIGFMELPYTSMPFNSNGEGMVTAVIAATKDFGHDVLLISGAKTDDDVMRGEETQLIGSIAPGKLLTNALFIFPGTHAKHISIKNNEVTGLKTYMTGEVFSLLAGQSILKNTIQAGGFDLTAFKRGVENAAARTNGLFELCTKNENFHYLSGLLIGAELKDIAATDAETIHLVCGNALHTPYEIALNVLAMGKKLNIFPAEQAEEATVRGQLIIAKHLALPHE
jgi:2-dehydro-3-deoxygalactonokinase